MLAQIPSGGGGEAATEAGPGFPPRLARPTSDGGPGKTGKSAALSHRAEAKPGPPHAVRIRTDTFLCPEKCPGAAAVGMGRAERFSQSRPFLCPGGAVARAVWARGGRVTVRRRTRRFGHAALVPCSVFAPRRTTRRQCRVWLGRHRAAGRAKRGRAPPCPAGLRRSPVLPMQCASEWTLFFVLKSVRNAACGGVGPGGAFSSKLPFPLFRHRRGKKVPPRVCGPRGGG